MALYHFESEQERQIIDFEREFKMRTGRSFDKINLDTAEGSKMAKLYDVTAYPAFLAISNDGVLQQLWQGEQMPLINELSYYSSGLHS